MEVISNVSLFTHLDASIHTTGYLGGGDLNHKIFRIVRMRLLSAFLAFQYSKNYSLGISLEISLTVYHSAQRNMPEDLKLYQHCSNLVKFWVIFAFFKQCRI
jgi:hypothetical protein